MEYMYFALFNPEGERYNVSFPELPGCFTFGENIEDALDMAKDALEGYLIVAEDEEDGIPTPSKQSDIFVPSSDLLIFIKVNTCIARLKEESELVKKTVTIPKYLNELGKESKRSIERYLDNKKSHLYNKRWVKRLRRSVGLPTFCLYLFCPWQISLQIRGNLVG